MKEHERNISREVQKLLEEKNVFAQIKQHLSDNDLGNFEIEHVVLKHIETEDADCPPDHKRVLVCSEGICEYQCIPTK